MLTSLFSLFYVTGEFHRFLHRGRAIKSRYEIKCYFLNKIKKTSSPCLVYMHKLCIQGVSNGLCEHASSAFIFVSTSSDQFPHESSEHFRNDKCEQRALRKFSASSLLKRYFAPSNLADTFKTGQQTQS